MASSLFRIFVEQELLEKISQVIIKIITWKWIVIRFKSSWNDVFIILLCNQNSTYCYSLPNQWLQMIFHFSSKFYRKPYKTLSNCEPRNCSLLNKRSLQQSQNISHWKIIRSSSRKSSEIHIKLFFLNCFSRIQDVWYFVCHRKFECWNDSVTQLKNRNKNVNNWP